jgi:hypothetical protein
VTQSLKNRFPCSFPEETNSFPKNSFSYNFLFEKTDIPPIEEKQLCVACSANLLYFLPLRLRRHLANLESKNSLQNIQSFKKCKDGI